MARRRGITANGIRRRAASGNVTSGALRPPGGTPMPTDLLAPEHLYAVKLAVTVGLLTLFWSWETWWPFFGWRESRLRHAGRNLTIALLNTVAVAAVFGSATVAVCGWSARHGLGLLHAASLPVPLRWALALVLLDGWTYLWH